MLSNNWRPSKFELKGKSWYPSEDINELAVHSRFIAAIQLKHYSEALRKYAKGQMLDLGCGKVPLYGIYKDKVESVKCADWEGTLHKNEFIDSYFDFNYSFPLSANEFDTVLATDVLEHIYNPDNFWKETTRILKQNGILILGVPFFYKLHEEPYDYFRYTKYILSKYCNDNDLRILDLYPYGGSIEILIDFLAKHISWSKLLSKINYSLGSWISGSRLGRMIYEKTSSKFPLGYILIAEKI
jgi:SAM-dependent methyltransferase